LLLNLTVEIWIVNWSSLLLWYRAFAPILFKTNCMLDSDKNCLTNVRLAQFFLACKPVKSWNCSFNKHDYLWTERIASNHFCYFSNFFVNDILFKTSPKVILNHAFLTKLIFGMNSYYTALQVFFGLRLIQVDTVNNFKNIYKSHLTWYRHATFHFLLTDNRLTNPIKCSSALLYIYIFIILIFNTSEYKEKYIREAFNRFCYFSNCCCIFVLFNFCTVLQNINKITQ